MQKKSGSEEFLSGISIFVDSQDKENPVKGTEKEQLLGNGDLGERGIPEGRRLRF